ncbi:tautomerase family protein [Caballeronia sp. INML1]|uniref:tautomerase family protein n=1 Tax=Caballeronia sp. INML1 TaxID=2921760 RepID=UPI002028B1A0|nr:tautomerase family protein [Caballeronia sp. INML1]
MPTYVVASAEGRFSSAEKNAIARGITDAHSAATGAQGFFAQVIFQEITSGNHFLGGSPLVSDQIFVHGHIRGGRTPDQKKQLLSEIVDAVCRGASADRRYVWAYVAELPPAQMVEFGKVLPEPGTEAQWLQAMSLEDRNYLLGIGK